MTLVPIWSVMNPDFSLPQHRHQRILGRSQPGQREEQHHRFDHGGQLPRHDGIGSDPTTEESGSDALGCSVQLLLVKDRP